MCEDLLKPESHSLGISWPVLVEERITVCRTFDGKTTLTTFQGSGYHFFSLNDEQAKHLASLLTQTATPVTIAPAGAGTESQEQSHV